MNRELGEAGDNAAGKPELPGPSVRFVGDRDAGMLRPAVAMAVRSDTVSVGEARGL